MPTDGMVIVGSTPAIPNAPPPARLAITTPMAPFAWAFAAFTTKPHTPRSISATLPATWAALTNGVSQPFAVPASPVAFPSSTRARSPVTPETVSGGPNDAPPAAHRPGVGLLIARIGTGVVNSEQPPTERVPPGVSV